MFSDCLQEAIACKAQYNLQTITRGECEGCSGRSEPGRKKEKETSETEQDHMVPAPPTTSSACLLSLENFNQRISLIREMRNVGTKENSQRRPNKNNVVIQHSQGPLVLSQGL